jgi:GcrA cell cycle regulator
MAWNEERTDLLKKFWAEGLSAGQICGRLGGTTRNAVIGKVHRLGLQGRATTVRMKSRQRAKKAARRLEFPKQPIVAVTPLPPEPPRPAKLVTLAKLKEDQCRFPFGDPKTADFGFCGCKKVAGASYCAGHLAMCTQAPTVRKKVYYSPSDESGRWFKDAKGRQALQAVEEFIAP